MFFDTLLRLIIISMANTQTVLVGAGSEEQY